MKKVEKIKIVSNVILLIISSIMMLLTIFKVSDVKLVLIILFASIILVKFVEFLLTRKEESYLSLTDVFASLICLIALIFVKENKLFLLIFLIWIGLNCLIKLKKADKYHDVNNSLWILEIIKLFIFLTISLLTALNLYQDSSIEIVLISEIFFINATLDLITSITTYLNGGKNEIS